MYKLLSFIAIVFISFTCILNTYSYETRIHKIEIEKDKIILKAEKKINELDSVLIESGIKNELNYEWYDYKSYDLK